MTVQERAFAELIEQGFNHGDLAVADRLMAADAVEHQVHAPDVPVVGPAAVKAIIGTLRRSFSDLRLEIQEMATAGDMVWARIRSTGTNDGPFFGNPPTGRRFAIDVIDVVRFRDGRIVEHWGVADRLGVMFQLGLLSWPSAPAS
jgi:predicted ester cyclase